MKKYLYLMLVLVASSGYSFQNVTPVTGEVQSFYKVAVTSSTAVVISNYGTSKNRTLCRNTSNVEVYLGSSTAVASQGANSYEVGPSTTNAASLFDTTNKSTLYAIAKAGGITATTTTANVYCEEER